MPARIAGVWTVASVKGTFAKVTAPGDRETGQQPLGLRPVTLRAFNRARFLVFGNQRLEGIFAANTAVIPKRHRF